MNKKLSLVYFSFWAAMLMTVDAHAYVDPTTTAMLIQIIAGIAISLGIAFGIFRQKIIMFFKNLKVKSLEKKISKEKEKK
ncbi:MAG: hypothetical protein FWG90_02375 [Oscillospiraceae bacterium]|nr:hypothetical protein [Oscillospiraceae bacterium]